MSLDNRLQTSICAPSSTPYLPAVKMIRRVKNAPATMGDSGSTRAVSPTSKR